MKPIIIKLKISIILSILLLQFSCKPVDVDSNKYSKDLFEFDSIKNEINNIAILSFIGKSESCPNDTLHHVLTDQLWQKFDSLTKSDSILHFISIEDVTENKNYQIVSNSTMPNGAYSPVKGLTYLKHGTSGGFDCEPLLKSMNVDAALIVIVFWGNAVRNNGSTSFIKATVEAGLIVPPEKVIWKSKGSSKYYEEQIPISIINDPVLSLSIGLKWVFLMSPSEYDYAKLTKHAIEKNPNFTDKIATSIFYNLKGSIGSTNE